MLQTNLKLKYSSACLALCESTDYCANEYTYVVWLMYSMCISTVYIKCFC